MAALLGFAPFLVFAVIENIFGIVPGLACGCAASLVLLARGFVRGERGLDILEAGSAAMFGVLAVLALTVKTAWTLWEVRLWVDSGLVLVVLLSIALGRPFTLRHGRRRVDAELARSAAFLRANMVVSGAWALAFAALAAVDWWMVEQPATPARRGILLSVLALAAAVRFTGWYTRRARGAAQGIAQR